MIAKCRDEVADTEEESLTLSADCGFRLEGTPRCSDPQSIRGGWAVLLRNDSAQCTAAVYLKP